MPLLAAYFDTSVVNFLLKKDKKSVEFFTFPYVYSKGTLSSQCDEQGFYKQLIEEYLSEKKIKINSCDIIISGFLNPPEISIKLKFSAGIMDVVQSSAEYIPIVVNSHSFITKDVVNSFSHCEDGNKLAVENKDFGELDYYSNLCIYPQMVSDDLSTQSDIDENISKRIPLNFKIETRKKIILTGGRFAQNVCSRELNYVLMSDLIRGHGVYNVFMDYSNAFPLVQLAKMYDKDVDIAIEDYIEHVGLYIKSEGSVECLLSTGVGEDQFMEIDKDKIFVMPLKLDSPARLSVKSSSLGSVDITTVGGEVGIVFDTRTGNESVYSDVRIFNDCIKQFGSAFKDTREK